ncbi:MAG: hypothetical protein WC379_12505 [Methanoregula sp.]|jgi:ribosomal protein L37AE/L43A
MEIGKNLALCLQALSVTILGLNFAGVRPDSLPGIIRPLFLVPWYAYVILIVVLLVVVVTQKERIKQKIGSATAPVLHKIDSIAYQDVTWDIVAPAQNTLEKQADYARRLPTIGEARIPPRCPKCGVELEEKKGLIYGYIWKCVSCGFKKRDKDSFFTEAGRAEKIWRAKAAAAVTTPAGDASATDATTTQKE